MLTLLLVLVLQQLLRVDVMRYLRQNIRLIEQPQGPQTLRLVMQSIDGHQILVRVLHRLAIAMEPFCLVGGDKRRGCKHKLARIVNGHVLTCRLLVGV